MIQENISLKNLNTFGIDAKTHYFCEVNTLADIQTILCAQHWRDVPKLVLGEGSNILLTQDFPGLVMKMQIPGIQVIRENEDHVWINAGAGESWHNLVLFCLENQYAGVENLSLIPGTVGAAPMQNIGAYGVELTQVFDSLRAVRISDAVIHEFKHADCHFGYRESVFKNQFKNQYIIADVTLRLNKKPVFHIEYGALKQVLAEKSIETEINIRKISDAVIKIRREKLPDPKVIGNAGSFFKNPVVSNKQFHYLHSQYPELPHYLIDQDHYKIPAGWLIEQCHWRGRRFGNVGVHQHHALVLVNYGGGSGKEVHQLAQAIQDSVKGKFAIEIQPEVNIV